MFECEFCGMNYTNHDSLRQHIYRNHCSKKKQYHSCYYCGFETIYKYGLSKHIGRKHLPKPKDHHGNVISCVLCNTFSCGFRRGMITHYQDDHGIKIQEETLHFETFEDFKNWKHRIESEESFRFIKTTGKTRFGKDYYHCFRNGFFKPEGTGKRRPKLAGSVRIGGVCPSSLKVTSHPTGKVSVQYVARHVGHSGDVGRMFLTKDERDQIWRRLEAGETVDDILSSIRQSIRGDKLSRLQRVTRKEIWNISRRKSYKSYANPVESDVSNSKVEQSFWFEPSEHSHDAESPSPNREEIECSVEEDNLENSRFNGKPPSESHSRRREPPFEEQKQAVLNNFLSLLDKAENVAHLRIIENALLPVPLFIEAHQKS